MDLFWQWMMAILAGIPHLFLNPFTYVLLILIALQWKRQIDMERKLFSVRLHSVAEGLLQSVFYGGLGGVLISLFFIGIGIVVDFQAFLYVWLIALVLMLFHIRFLCFAYASAILGLAVFIVRLVPQGLEVAWLRPVWQELHSIYLPSLFMLVALLHLLEAFLVYLVGDKRGTPMFIHSKRGRIVGAYHIQHIWFVPLFLVAGGGQQGLAPFFVGWPLFAPEIVGPLSLMLLPTMLGYSEQAISSTPREKARFSAKHLTWYSLLLLFITCSAVFVLPELIILAIFFSFLGHEALFLLSRYREQEKAPIYVHPAQGLKILAVVPHSPAAKMGLQAGEVLLKVNGQALAKRSQLYAALTSNLAFCKLEVLNNQGHLKFVQTSIYQEDHHQLGVILAPDQETPYYLEEETVNLWRLLRQKVHRKANQNTLEG